MRKTKGRTKHGKSGGPPESPLEPGDDVGVRDIDPRCYWDDDFSEGGRVKKQGLVLKTRLHDHADERVNFNCRIETFGRVLGQFCETKRKLVAEMGMERLFCLVDMGLPRNLCYWLATRVDVPNRKLVVPNGVEFNLSPVQVQWVLGLPDGPNRLPKKANSLEMRAEVGSIWEKYHTVSPQGVKGITRRTLMEAVEGPVVAGEEEEFKRVFLMMALADVLCPTTCHRFSAPLLPVVTVASEAAEYDFCSLVLDHLLHAIESFAKRFYADGFANGCGGCTFFLAIYYLDRLRRPPVRWGAFPRISAWSTNEVNAAKNEDLRDCGDFGELGCFDIAYGESHPMLPRDVRPGVSEGVMRPAPNFLKIKGIGRKRRGRNSELNPHHYAVMKAARMQQQQQGGGEDPVSERGDGNVGEASTWHTAEVVEHSDENVEENAEELEEEEELDGNRSGGVDSNVRVPGHNVHTPTNSVINSRELDEIMMGLGVGDNPITHPSTPVGASPYVWSSMAKGKGKMVAENENESGLEGQGSVQSSSRHCNREMYLEDAECNSSNMPEHEQDNEGTPPWQDKQDNEGTPPGEPMEEDLNEEDGTKERSRLQRKTKSSSRLSSAYVRTWRKPGLWRYRKRLSLFVSIASGQIVSPDTQLIRCSGMFATVEDCSTVVDKKKHLHPNFVRVAGLMYEKVWAKVFTERSKRIMLDPDFGTEAAASDIGSVHRDAMFRACLHFVEVPRNKVDVIFVPVLHGSHWWCAAFSMKACDVAIIDPVDPFTAADQHHLSIIKLKYAVDTLMNLKFSTWLLGRCGAFKTYTVRMNNGGNVHKSGVQMLAAIKRSAWRLTFDVFMDREEEEESWLLAEDVLCNHNELISDVKELLDAHMKY